MIARLSATAISGMATSEHKSATSKQENALFEIVLALIPQCIS